MDYLRLLEESYKTEMGILPGSGRLEFIAVHIFDFTTYESEVSALMAKKALEVCEAITNRKTFDYIRSAEGHLWYLIIVNMPFLVDKLDWGSSIRSAWWDVYGDFSFTIKSCGLWFCGKQLTVMELNEQQWPKFIKAMVVFTNGEDMTGLEREQSDLEQQEQCND